MQHLTWLALKCIGWLACFANCNTMKFKTYDWSTWERGPVWHIWLFILVNTHTHKQKTWPPNETTWEYPLQAISYLLMRLAQLHDGLHSAEWNHLARVLPANSNGFGLQPPHFGGCCLHWPSPESGANGLFGKWCARISCTRGKREEESV